MVHLSTMKVTWITQILKNNSYQLGIIQQTIKSFLNNLYVPKKVIPTVPKKPIFIVLPYGSKDGIQRKAKTKNLLQKFITTM